MFIRYLLLLFCGTGLSISAQPSDEPDSVITDKEVLKKIFIVRKSEPEPPSQPSLNITENKDLNKDDLNLKVELKSTPVMIADKDGLMNIVELKPHKTGARLPKNESYVVFSFKINQWGFVSEINIYDTNHRPLVDLLIHKLDRTVWKPAYDKDGNRIDYSFDHWIAKVPTKIKPRDYEDYDYRF